MNNISIIQPHQSTMTRAATTHNGALVKVAEDAVARCTEFFLHNLVFSAPKILGAMTNRLLESQDTSLDDVLAKVKQTASQKFERQENLRKFLDICLSFAVIFLSKLNGQRSAPLSESKATDDTAEAGIKYNIVGVALFSGTDPFSKVIKGITQSKTSHVGIILANSENENEWYCFESTGSVDEVLKGQAPNVRITPWNQIVDTYDGKVSYRLTVFEDKERTDPEFVTGFVNEYDQKPYTKNPVRLLKAFLRENKESKSSSLKTVFCSELTAKMFMDLEILEKGMFAGNYIPKDFSTEGAITLKSGVTLTPAFQAK